MRNILLMSSALMFGAVHVAIAQEASNSHTLDGQMQRVEEGQPAVPMATTETSPSAAAPSTTQDAAPQNIPMVTSDAVVTPAAPVPAAAEPATKEAPAATQPVEKPTAKKKKKSAKKSAHKDSGDAAASAQTQGNAANPDLFTKPITEPETPPAQLPVARNGEAIDSVGNGAIPALPLSVMEQHNVKYITGGVGYEEETQLKSVADQFNVQLMFTAAQGEYLGNAMVRVMDDKGNELVSIDHAGPYFYTHLNPGNYTVEVTAKQGGIKTLPVKVASSGTVKDQIRFSE